MSDIQKHPMERWREEAGIGTRSAAARLLGISTGSYGDIIHGRAEMSAARMRRVIELTEGAITADELVWWREQRAASQG